MRLIDADALTDDTHILAPIVRAWLDDQPTVDAVEVVRCKDCKYWMEEMEFGMFCNYCGSMLTETRGYDYCSYGERKIDSKNRMC